MDELLAMAIEAAVLAGNEIMRIYESDFNFELKEDNSPLTEADNSANKIINKILSESQIPIISEENKQVDYQQRKNWEKCWIVDPLDGTKEFIKRNGEFTVNIALIENNNPILGVIYIPVKKIIYYSIVSHNKAFNAIVDSSGFDYESIKKTAIEIKPSSPDSKKLIVISSRSHLNEETTQFINSFESNHDNIEYISAGSSLKFCYIADGKAHLYPRFAPTMEWDTAAGHAICKGVGIELLNINSTNPLKYNKENLKNPYFICQSK